MMRKCVPDELYGRLNRKIDELKLRIDQGPIPLQRAINDLQFLVEGRTFQRHLIDCNADPFQPSGWRVENHKKHGTFEWDPTRVRLHLSLNQKHGKSIEGHRLREELASEPVLNANVLDYLLKHPELISEEWKGKCIFFWGTIYRAPDKKLFVRYLFFNDGQWIWRHRWLGDCFRSGRPAACSQA